MERLKVGPDEAFEILKRSSKRLNLKLREVAGRVAETGEVDRHDLRPSSGQSSRKDPRPAESPDPGLPAPDGA
jgi:hypothetical protein